MGRPPQGGGPAFRFTPNEVTPTYPNLLCSHSNLPSSNTHPSVSQYPAIPITISDSRCCFLRLESTTCLKKSESLPMAMGESSTSITLGYGIRTPLYGEFALIAGLKPDQGKRGFYVNVVAGFKPLQYPVVMEMEACLQEIDSAIPAREVICSLAEKFSASEDRAGKVVVQPKQVLNWFQNRRYAQRVKMNKAPGKLNVTPTTRDDSAPPRTAPIPVPVPVPVPAPVPAGGTPMEFEAKSARDGAWYDVSTFISHRMFETSDPEVRVRFAGFSAEEDEWINVRKCVRQRSLPCEATECAAVVPGDLILCFQEGKEQALYFDAHVLDAQRRRHDVRGCRCRFLVRYDHDQSEEIVPLRKICRRPETDYRLQGLNASKDSASVPLVNSSSDTNSTALKTRRHRKAEEATMVVDPGTTVATANESQNMETTVMKGENNKVAPDSSASNAACSIVSGENVQGT